MNHRSDSLKEHAQQIWAAGVQAVNAAQRTRNFVSCTSEEIRFGDSNQNAFAHSDYRNLIVVGAGKASGEMAVGLEQALGKQFPAAKKLIGLINVPDDKVIETKRIQLIPCRPAGINLPTERVLAATDRIIELLQIAHPDDLCIVLIAGGGSALLERPVSPISLADFQSVTKLLSHRGAGIEDLNTVRRRLSLVKGGGLARLANCRRIVTLLISDVLGDPLNVIASGPTVIDDPNVPTPTANSLAMEVLKKFDPELGSVPVSVIDVLQRSDPKCQNDLAATEVRHLIIANNELAVAAAKQTAESLGYHCESETDRSNDSAEAVAGRLVEKLGREPNSTRDAKWCFISGGEPTVRLAEQPGSGGRNQQLVLAAMLELLQQPKLSELKFSFLAGGTDGEDGNVSVAGAVFDSTDLSSLNSSSQIARLRRHLETNDSYPVLKDLGCIFESGPTGTNVCDIRVLVVRSSESGVN